MLDTDHVVFTSMGMFIIDEIHFPNEPSVYDICGGGGTYGLLGARIILSSAHSRQVGWIVDCGSDFPLKVKEEIEKWGTGVIFREDDNRLTTRGWNSYGDNEIRYFKYLTPKKRIEVDDLIRYENLLRSDSYHLICSPERCTEIMSRLNVERQRKGVGKAPVVVWEPVPDLCRPAHLANCLLILKQIDILSPNAQEAALFFDLPEPDTKPELEAVARRFLPHMTKPNSGIILRCGKLGSLVLNNRGMCKWFPLYHHPDNVDYKVVDTTGGGNTFIGSLCTGFVKSGGDWDIGAICGNIGSGLAIEQIGMPVLSEGDQWNGATVQERIKRYLQRNDLGVDVDHVLQVLYN